MKIPNRLPIDTDITGTKLKREFNKLLDFVRSITPRGDEKTIKINTTSSGTTFSLVNQSKGRPGADTFRYWAKVTAVTDANNYTVSIYDRKDEGTALESSKQCRVFDITDQLAVGDWIPVQASNVTGEDYECTQQLGVIG